MLEKSFIPSILLTFICTMPCLPCDCQAKRSVQAELDASAAVFCGKIVQMHWFEKESKSFSGKRQIKQIIIVTVQVSKIWKGDIAREVEVETGDPEEDNCGVPFKKEEEFLIYAVAKKRLETDVCSRTKLLSAASDDLQQLGAGREP